MEVEGGVKEGMDGGIMGMDAIMGNDAEGREGSERKRKGPK